LQTQISGVSTIVDSNTEKLTGISYDSSNDTTNINNNVNVTGNLMNLSPTIYSYLSGITSNVQTQLTTNTNNISTNTSSISSLNSTVASLNSTVSSLTAIGTLVSYSSSSTFTFSGGAYSIMPNRITLTSGTWLISAYVQYYSTAGQTNPLVIANVCYYIG
jgi:hypothetical protein